MIDEKLQFDLAAEILKKFLPEEMHGEYCTDCLRKKMDFETVYAYARDEGQADYLMNTLISDDDIYELAKKKYEQCETKVNEIVRSIKA